LSRGLSPEGSKGAWPGIPFGEKHENEMKCTIGSLSLSQPLFSCQNSEIINECEFWAFNHQKSKKKKKKLKKSLDSCTYCKQPKI
jgi:hypothetical protein